MWDDCDAEGCVDGKVTCDQCEGSGEAFGIQGGPDCPHCDGTGEVDCGECGGTGRKFYPN